VAEVYRAGINSVHRSQVAAARSLGLSQSSSMRYVILPQAIRNIIPPLLNDFISLQKDTAQVGLLGAIEANKAAEIYSQINHKIMEGAYYLPFVVDKALNYRNPRLTNAYVHDAFGMLDFQALGVSDGK
jgi:ABC-type amino acid transport system permease subunit